MHESLPDDQLLLTGLTAAFGIGKRETGGVTVLQRTLNTHASSHPAETILCRVGGMERTVLVKYGNPREWMPSTARGGVGYEAVVYQHVLQPHAISSPPLVGVFESEETGATWLVIEYLEGCSRLDDHKTAVVKASAWLGAFHGYAESTWSPNTLPFLKVYDEAYYEQWVKGAVTRLAPLESLYPWIPALIETVKEHLPSLPSAARVLIHGELYPHNVLVRQDNIYAIDWESAAFALPEIDLASLIDGWEKKTVAACISAYKLARWGMSVPEGFERTVVLAEMYWNLRWLSGLGKKAKPFDSSTLTAVPHRLAQLRANCNQLSSL